MSKENKSLNIVAAEVLGKMIADVKRAGARFDALVQAAAFQCVAQSVLHRNILPGQDLLDSLPKGSRRDSLVAYFEKFGNFAWMKQDRKLAFYEAVGAAEWTADYASVARAFMWTSGTKPAAIVSAYDLDDLTGKFLDKIGKLVDDSTKEVRHRDLYAKLKAVYTAHVVEGFNPEAENDEVEKAAA